MRRDHYTPIDSTSIPTGDIVPVRATPFDFQAAHAVGKHIDEVEGALDGHWVHLVGQSAVHVQTWRLDKSFELVLQAATTTISSCIASGPWGERKSAAAQHPARRSPRVPLPSRVCAASPCLVVLLGAGMLSGAQDRHGCNVGSPTCELLCASAGRSSRRACTTRSRAG